MRPERLVVEGFTTFRERTEVDFSGADLFALTGATGAGKSSLIDAIVFALYGSIPRLDDRRLVAPVISQDKVEARVRLDFSIDGERYRAVRVVREVAGKARAAGAVIIGEPHDEEFGYRAYRAMDPEGHRWYFGTRLAS